tara:strand:+ start:158 stop:580 length:423 start_codon:yes stop_codon:yes gene_type:complete
MFHKNLSGSERLNIWRNVRQKPHNNISEVLEEFATIDPLPRYLDYYTPSSWPNPFEIVNEGYLCQSGVTLVLLSTLINKGFISEDTIQLPVISNNITGTSGLVIYDRDFVYNFTPGKIVSWDYVKENATIFQIHNQFELA